MLTIFHDEKRKSDPLAKAATLKKKRLSQHFTGTNAKSKKKIQALVFHVTYEGQVVELIGSA
jgi:hypothetical protein